MSVCNEHADLVRSVGQIEGKLDSIVKSLDRVEEKVADISDIVSVLSAGDKKRMISKTWMIAIGAAIGGVVSAIVNVVALVS